MLLMSSLLLISLRPRVILIVMRMSLMLILIFLLALLLIPLWTYFLLSRYILCYVHGVYTSSQDLLSTVLHGVSSRFSITFLLAVPIPMSFVFRANASHVLVMVMTASNWTLGLIPVEKAVHMIWAFLLLDFLLVTLHIILLLNLLLSPPILRFVIIVLLVLLWQLVTIPRVNLVIIILIWSKVLLLSPNIWSTFLAKNIYECIFFFRYPQIITVLWHLLILSVMKGRLILFLVVIISISEIPVTFFLILFVLHPIWTLYDELGMDLSFGSGST